MATVSKDFRVKAGLVVEGSTATVNGKNIITAGVVDAKGDLIVGSADDAVARLGVGTNGQVLTANSGATYGVEWSAPAAVGVFGSSIEFEGATANAFETTLAVTDPTADRTITLPDATGTVALTSDVTTHANLTEAHGATGAVVGTTNTQTLTNKTLTSPKINEDVVMSASSTELNILDGATLSTTELNYVDGVTSAIQTQLDAKATSSDLTTHTGATEAHGATGAVVGTTNTQTLTNKTLTSPNVSGLVITDASIVLEGTTADANETTLTVGEPTADRTITFPDATGTVALTNNKLSAFAATSSSELAGVLSDETGTGALVFANTPTLVTPNIGAATGTSLVLSGDLTVNGTTTTINSTEITIDDKNLVLGSVATPTDAGADGGGLTLKGATDKTFSWIDATDAWTSSEHLDLAAGKVLKVAGTQVLSATEYTGNAATVTNGVYTTSKISALAATSSSELAGVISDETGTGALVFANTPTLVTPVLGAATATTIAFGDALIGSNTGTAGTSSTNIDAWAVSSYSAAKYVVQLKKSGDIEVIEVLVAVDGSNNVYVTEYANIQSNGQLGTTDASYDGSGSVVLQVTAASADTSVKISKTYIEA
jgi:AraC-like DNA-binding protein